MADPRQRSKRRSHSKKASSGRPLKGFTLYLCHNIDFDEVVDALNRAGIRYKRHRDHFKGSAPDTELLRKVGEERWILVTADQKQRTRIVEKNLIQQYKVREFVFTSRAIGNVGEVLVKACKKMRAICKKNAGPFVYGITQSGL